MLEGTNLSISHIAASFIFYLSIYNKPKYGINKLS